MVPSWHPHSHQISGTRGREAETLPQAAPVVLTCHRAVIQLSTNLKIANKNWQPAYAVLQRSISHSSRDSKAPGLMLLSAMNCQLLPITRLCMGCVARNKIEQPLAHISREFHGHHNSPEITGSNVAEGEHRQSFPLMLHFEMKSNFPKHS